MRVHIQPGLSTIWPFFFANDNSIYMKTFVRSFAQTKTDFSPPSCCLVGFLCRHNVYIYWNRQIIILSFLWRILYKTLEFLPTQSVDRSEYKEAACEDDYDVKVTFDVAHFSGEPSVVQSVARSMCPALLYTVHSKYVSKSADKSPKIDHHL